ncbi:MAG: Autotransporter-associated beta strand repeat protein [Verrucomicrobia bacterium ADurb.Bin070]|nr:MAG: Autotransporter-associated beta strand repeat protein [Verrucomicrobia bacterium ADurb.Bin070]
MNFPADAFCMFLHNDPRGPGYAQGNVLSAGFLGMQNSVGVRWYFYPGNTTGEKNRVAIGYNGTFLADSRQLYEPVLFYSNAVTRVTVQYDPVAKTLTSIIGNDGPRSDTLNPSREFRAVTNVFTDVDIAQRVGGEYAYVGFGGGTGGVNAEMRVRDVRFASDAPSDAMSAVASLASLELPAGATGLVMLDSPVPDGTFNMPALALGDGAVLALAAHDSFLPTLALGTVALDGEGVFDVAASARCEAGPATGTGPLVKRGAGTLALAGATAAYVGDTRLEAGTLALDAARLPRATDLHVTSGATLGLAFTGKQYVHALYVDGAPMPGGLYTAEKVAWITGPGTLVVTYPPVGSMLFLK